MLSYLQQPSNDKFLFHLSMLHISHRVLYEEIDYINEGKNADRFRRDFRNVKWVRVPVSFLNYCINLLLLKVILFVINLILLLQRVLWDYTSRKVLTLEYVPG